MYLTVSIACLNKVSLTLQCLNCLKSSSSDINQIQFILTDNGSEDATYNELMKFPFPNKLVIKNKTNLGFGAAHNKAFEQAIGTYFLVLNNDLFIYENGWDVKLVSLLERADKALVGIKGTHCTFRSDGTGYKGTRIDYIEGSFLAGATTYFRQFGLFSPEIKMFVAEDSDLSMRYRQMGFKLLQIDLKHRHVDHATLDTIDSNYKSKIFESNRKILYNRWSKCFESKTFKNRILLSLSSVGIGDVLCSTPVIKPLRRDHPTARIDVETRFPEVFQNHPEINRIFEYSRVSHNDFDRTVKLNPNYYLNSPMYKEFEKLASVTLESKRPEIYLTQAELDRGKELLRSYSKGKVFNKYIVCSLLMERVEWEGRNWSLENLKIFMKHLRARIPNDYAIVEIGSRVPKSEIADIDLVDKTNLRELFSIISQCHFLVGIDSLPFHVAQAFEVKSLILFGATRPFTRIVNDDVTKSMTHPTIKCLGCYHDKRETGFNTCDRRDEMCMRGIDPKQVAMKTLELIDGNF